MAHEIKDVLLHLTRRGLILNDTNSKSRLGPLGIGIMRNLYQEWRRSVSILGGKAYNVLELQPALIDDRDRLLNNSNSLLNSWNLDRNDITSMVNPIRMMNPTLPFVMIRCMNSMSCNESFSASLRFFCEPKESQLLYHTWKKERTTWWRKLSINRPGRFILEEDGLDDNKTLNSARIILSYNNYKEVVEDISYSKESNEIENNICSADTFHTITCSSHIDKGVLAYLIDAYQSRQSLDAHDTNQREYKSLKLHPRLAPIKAAVMMSDVNRIHILELAGYLTKKLNSSEIFTWMESSQSMEESYKKHDEMGTLFCIVVDDDTIKYGDVKIRHRDTGLQEQIHLIDVKLCIERDLQNSYQHTLPPDLLHL